MRIEIYDKIMGRIWLSVIMFFIWLIGTASFFGVFWVLVFGVKYLVGYGISSQALLILAATIGGPFSIFATLFIQSMSKYGSSDGFDFRDWWMILGYEVDFGQEKSKKLKDSDLKEWAAENCSQIWRKANKNYYSTWIFKDESEAMAFKLRWS